MSSSSCLLLIASVALGRHCPNDSELTSPLATASTGIVVDFTNEATACIFVVCPGEMGGSEGLLGGGELLLCLEGGEGRGSAGLLGSGGPAASAREGGEGRGSAGLLGSGGPAASA